MGNGRVVAITAPLAYPLHRRTLSVWQRHGGTAGVVVGMGLVVLALLFAVGSLRDRNTAGMVIGVAAIVLAPVAFFVGRRLSTFSAADGMVTVQPDRLEIADERSFPQPLLLRRSRILAICSPGVVDEQPALRVHIGRTHDVMQLGTERPNVEVWLADPIARPWPPAPPGQAHRPVAVLQMQTPGAGTMIEWFREGLTEIVAPRWFDVEGTDSPFVDPF